MRKSNRAGMTYRKLSDSAKRAVITSRIRKGDTHRIASEMGYSVSHVPMSLRAGTIIVSY